MPRSGSAARNAFCGVRRFRNGLHLIRLPRSLIPIPDPDSATRLRISDFGSRISTYDDTTDMTGQNTGIGALRSSLDLSALGAEMHERIRRLYPICRSITGNGLR